MHKIDGENVLKFAIVSKTVQIYRLHSIYIGEIILAQNLRKKAKQICC